MRVLMISGDPLALNPESGVHKRLLLQAARTEFLTVFVPAKEPAEIALGDKGIVRGFSGSKVGIARAMANCSSAKREKFDVVTAQDPFFLGHIAWHIARRSKIKIQFQIHTDIFSPEFAKTSLANRLKVIWAKFHLHRADCIRVVSNRIKESLLNIGIRAPILVLPIFTDIEAVKAAPAMDLKKEYPQFSKIMLVAARLEKEKNIGDAIRAMPEILKSFPKVGLLIAGGGSQKKALKKLAQDLEIANQVIFLGHRSDVYSLYKGADCCIAATADYEGFGAATVDALAAHCPVVSRDAGIAREAGAVIASKSEIAQKVIEVVHSSKKGELQLQLPSAEEWAGLWYAGIAACCRSNGLS